MPFFLPFASSSRSFSLPISQLAAGSAATCLSSRRTIPALRASSSVITTAACWAPSSFFRVLLRVDFVAGASAAFSALCFAASAARMASACALSSAGVICSKSFAMLISSLFIFIFFCRCQQRIDLSAASFFSFRTDDAYVIGKGLRGIPGRFRMLTYRGDVVHLLLA